MAAGFYVSKYITADLSRSAVSVGSHLYWCSIGLRRAQHFGYVYNREISLDLLIQSEGQYCSTGYTDKLDWVSVCEFLDIDEIIELDPPVLCDEDSWEQVDFAGWCNGSIGLSLCSDFGSNPDPASILWGVITLKKILSVFLCAAFMIISAGAVEVYDLEQDTVPKFSLMASGYDVVLAEVSQSELDSSLSSFGRNFISPGSGSTIYSLLTQRFNRYFDQTSQDSPFWSHGSYLSSSGNSTTTSMNVSISDLMNSGFWDFLLILKLYLLLLI